MVFTGKLLYRVTTIPEAEKIMARALWVGATKVTIVRLSDAIEVIVYGNIKQIQKDQGYITA